MRYFEIVDSASNTIRLVILPDEDVRSSANVMRALHARGWTAKEISRTTFLKKERDLYGETV